jgi:hypothetical protein
MASLSLPVRTRALTLACALGLAPRASQGADSQLELEYRAPMQCPSAAALRGSIEKLVSSRRPEHLSVRITIESDSDGYRSRIQAAGRGERVLRGAACSDVAEATAVVVALWLGPEPRPKPNRVGKLTTVTPSVIDAGVAPRVAVGPRLAAASGLLPEPGLGLGGRLELESRGWSVLLDGSYWLTQRTDSSEGTERGGEFGAWSLSLTPCLPFRPGPAQLRLAACVGPELGRMWGNGRGVDVPRHASALWFGAVGGFDVSVQISRSFRTSAGLGLAVLVDGRHSFVLNHVETLHQPSRWSGRANFGGDFTF